MLLLSSFFTIEAIRLDVDISSKKRLFEEAAFLVEAAYGESHDDVFEALVTREKLGSTAVGKGCAIPHARLANITEPMFVFLRTAKPLEFDAPDEKPVRLFFVIVVPADAPETHLPLLRAIAELLKDGPMRQKLDTAIDPVDICSAIAIWDGDHNT